MRQWLSGTEQQPMQNSHSWETRNKWTEPYNYPSYCLEEILGQAEDTGLRIQGIHRVEYWKGSPTWSRESCIERRLLQKRRSDLQGVPLKSPLEHWSLHVREEITLVGKRTSEKANNLGVHTVPGIVCSPVSQSGRTPQVDYSEGCCLWSRES